MLTGSGYTRGGGSSIRSCTILVSMLLVGEGKDRERRVYMMTHGARLLVIFCIGFPSYAHWIAFMICNMETKCINQYLFFLQGFTFQSVFESVQEWVHNFSNVLKKQLSTAAAHMNTDRGSWGRLLKQFLLFALTKRSPLIRFQCK